MDDQKVVLIASSSDDARTIREYLADVEWLEVKAKEEEKAA